MATRHLQQQPPLRNISKEVQFVRSPLDRSARSELELELEEYCRQFEAGDYEEEEDEELQEQEDDSPSNADVETRKEQEEVFPGHTQPQAENFSVHSHSQMEMQHSASAGHFSKDPEALSTPSMSAMPSNADLLASMDVIGSAGSFPSKQVEGALQSCLASAEGQVTRHLQQAMDTAQSQVLRALHQAATDIIENLGKEAARRVVVAERKAALLELELSSVKQQALSMLLRLKADSDAQALDADKKYLLERRRAQDAEAKLAIAQDTSKRLKAELKKKGDTLDKMQKLVQPMTEDRSQNPSRSMELTGRLESSVKGINKDRHRKSPVCSVEGTSFMMCSAALHHEVHCPQVQPNMEAALQAVDDYNEKQSSLSSKTPAVEEDYTGLRKQTCSSDGIRHHSQCSPSRHEEDFLSRKTDEGRGASLVADQVELSEHVEGSHQVMFLEANSGEEDRLIQQRHNTEILPPAEFADEKFNPVPGACQRSVDSNEFNQGSSAGVKGFYVRRKVRESGKLQEKKESSIEHCLNSGTEHDLKDNGLRSSNETASKLKTDMSEGEHQTCSLRRDSQVFLDATDSSSLLGHVVQLAAEFHEDLASDLPEEISSSDFSKGVDLGSSTTRDEVVTETVELARPDYEVATSLAALASIGLDVKSQEMEPLPQIGSKECIFLKPGRTGLRMKRKGISFERRATLQAEGKVIKKPRQDKLASGLIDSHTERVLRRNRGRKYSILKDSLSLESSRDNRRLMQGARQLLCLAEKKW
ncbi:hypothetical protein GOP47_0015538 [Adiantum capillus-veneris]|uniref:Uncharacterized protein n=1 Tax=Adiantum capillus-veneris TaxID=13818 RepID=A0A9D4UKM7_ADICA|nr:hypothetical protein GOP47_0015538 [Adiantum capillus-veneris]